MTDTTKAKKAAILTLMHGYPSSQGQVSQGTVDAYLMAVSGCSLDAVTRSCQQFLSGKVEGHNNSFMPTAAELAANARQWDDAIAKVTSDRELAALSRLVSYPIGAEPPPPAVPLGPLSVDFGSGPIDMRDMTPAEKEFVMVNKRAPDPQIGGDIKPRLKGML